MSGICPETIIRTTSNVTNGTSPNIILLSGSSNTANLERIVFNVHEPVLLRLLVCKEEKAHPDICSFPEHENTYAVKFACKNSEVSLAQIYMRHEQINLKARSCVLIFIDGKYLQDTEKIIKIYENTVNWLNIADEKPFLYVLRFGDSIGLTTKFIGIDINKKLKNIYRDYTDTEDICIMVSVARRAKPLVVNCTSKFSFNAS